MIERDWNTPDWFQSGCDCSRLKYHFNQFQSQSIKINHYRNFLTRTESFSTKTWPADSFIAAETAQQYRFVKQSMGIWPACAKKSRRVHSTKRYHLDGQRYQQSAKVLRPNSGPLAENPESEIGKNMLAYFFAKAEKKVCFTLPKGNFWHLLPTLISRFQAKPAILLIHL